MKKLLLLISLFFGAKSVFSGCTVLEVKSDSLRVICPASIEIKDGMSFGRYVDARLFANQEASEEQEAWFELARGKVGLGQEGFVAPWDSLEAVYKKNKSKIDSLKQIEDKQRVLDSIAKIPKKVKEAQLHGVLFKSKKFRERGEFEDPVDYELKRKEWEGAKKIDPKNLS